ncbi:hypothetical protein D6D00_03967 [Aureobasidium pullulans]|nr:hypothetical protein D6D00_03967 [Aureobasidium pullulans]
MSYEKAEMEEHSSFARVDTAPSSSCRPRLRHSLMIFAMCSTVFHWLGGASYLLPSVGQDEQQSPAENKTFSWDTVEPSTSLEYSSCYEGYQCAKLELPMDYWNGTTDAMVTLALVKKPAAVPVTDPRYGGVILMNPGGPGGHGVGFILRAGKQLSSLLNFPGDDGDDGKQFDLISFDPRGVGLSTPRLSCFQGNTILEQAWLVREWEEGSFNASDIAFGRLWAMSKARVESCAITSEEPDIKRYVTTAYVARDMLEIVEKHDAWRAQEARRLSASQHHEAIDAHHFEYQPGTANLQYWGFSYGTYLGSVFAAMFPERVERLVLDGVVDVVDYQQAAWATNLVDTEKTMDSFYRFCAEAGYPACALANSHEKTRPEEVKQRTFDIIQNLHENPLAVIGPNPEVITSNDIRMLIFRSLYKPMTEFPVLANTLTELESGNGTNAAQMLRPHHAMDCKATSTNDLPNSPDAEIGIACTDGDDQTEMNKTTFASFVDELAEVSPTIGDIWASIRMSCIHYPLRAVHRFTGPWEATTAHPILLIGNTADPVTPLNDALRMSDRLAGSMTLIQDSAGHCSLSAYSECTAKYVRQYFHTGELPPANTTCAVDEKPFEVKEAALRTVAHEQHRNIADAFFKFGVGRQVGRAD